MVYCCWSSIQISPCSSSREHGINIPLFIHQLSSFVFPKCSWSPKVTGSWWMSVSGVSSPIDDLSVFSWSQLGVPFLLLCSLGIFLESELSPSKRVMLSEEGEQALGAGTYVQGKNCCHLMFWFSHLSLTAPLTSSVPLAGTFTSLFDSLMFWFTSHCVCQLSGTAATGH